MRYKRLNACIILLLGFEITGMHGQMQTPFEVKESQNSAVEYYASNYGIFGLNTRDGRSGFIYPRGSNNQYLFGSGIWFGAKKQVTHDGGTTFQEEKLSFICYNPNSGGSWGTPGEYGAASGTTPILYRSSDYDRHTGASISAPVNDPKWPLWLMEGEQTDPFFAGNFVPLNADRTAGTTYTAPAFTAGVDEQFFSRYHDQDLSRYEIGAEQAGQLGYPLGLQVQEHVYSWNPGNPMQNVVILQYEVTNVSDDVLRECYIAQAIDLDIGTPGNDRMMFYDAQPNLHTGIAWTESEGQDHGLLTMVMLEGPITDENGFIDNSRRGLFSSQAQVGLFRNWTSQNDPRTPEERYDFMAGAVLSGDNGPEDKRVLMGSRAFNMAPGDKAYFTFAFAVLDGVTTNGMEEEEQVPQGTQIPELEAFAEDLHARYYITGFNASVSSTQEKAGHSGLSLTAAVSPNPGSGNTTLRLTLTNRSDLRIRIIDNLGRTIRTENVSNAPAGQILHRLNLEGIDAGSYLISVEAGTEQQSVRLNVVR